MRESSKACATAWWAAVRAAAADAWLNSAFGFFRTYVAWHKYTLPNEASTYLPTSAACGASGCATYLPTLTPT